MLVFCLTTVMKTLFRRLIPRGRLTRLARDAVNFYEKRNNFRKN